jgi:DNA polymerase-3 subunit epsilon
MKIIVFDTETTSLPVNYNAPLTDSSKWPHIIQLSYIVFDTEKKEILDYTDRIIKLDSTVNITPESIAIHQITYERSQREGISIQEALIEFAEAIQEADIMVGHNISFDKNLIMVEQHRNRMQNCLSRNGLPIPDYCTMKRSVELCKLPTHNAKYPHQYKWPTLTELHSHLFKTVPKGTHNAIADVMICMRCYVLITCNYDIAFDNEVKMVFRALFANYCLGVSPPDPLGGKPPHPLGVSPPHPH